MSIEQEVIDCSNCGGAIIETGGAWAHATGKVYCPGGEPFGEVAKPISERARAYNEALTLQESKPRNGPATPQQVGYFDAGFKAGAEWQASRPVTDAEVERAAVVMAEVTGEPRPGRFERTMARAALEAARREQA